jgi:hypothetical protein
MEHKEWLLIDKQDNYYYFKDVHEICEFTHLTKSQVNNVYQQSLKHINRYTNRGYYIQRLFNLPQLHERKKFPMIRNIYFTDHTQEKYHYKKNTFTDFLIN